jgi:Flp pilus assembly protein TadD
MIMPVIIVLALALVALLVDWRKVFANLPKRQPRSAPRRDTRMFQKGPSAPAASDNDLFPFTPPAETEPEQGTGSPELDKLLAEADIHFRKGEMKAAEQLYLQVAAQSPRCSKAYGRLGVIYLENGDDWEDAEAAFRQALKTDPGNGYVLNNLGLVLYHQDKFADAIRHFEQAVHLDELNASRHANLGMAYMAMRQYAKAESSFKKALKLAPQEMEYKDLLAEAVEKKLAHKTMVRR